MKRSRIFLTVSAAVLAVAAFAASKSTHKTRSVGYFTTVAGGKCNGVTSGRSLTLVTTSTAHANTPTAQTLHTAAGVGSNCGHKLYSGE